MLSTREAERGETRTSIGADRQATRESSRQRVVTAAFETLRAEGFAGTSPRTIADQGGFNQSQVFYYFGTVNDLLLAALERSSREQLTAYHEALDEVTTLSELFQVVGTLHQADVKSGHVKVLAELIGASASEPALKAEVATLVDPWLQLTEQTLTRVLEPTGLTSLIPANRSRSWSCPSSLAWNSW